MREKWLWFSEFYFSHYNHKKSLLHSGSITQTMTLTCIFNTYQMHDCVIQKKKNIIPKWIKENCLEILLLKPPLILNAFRLIMETSEMGGGKPPHLQWRQWSSEAAQPVFVLDDGFMIAALSLYHLNGNNVWGRLNANYSVYTAELWSTTG